MKQFIIALAFMSGLISPFVDAHDEGHGPKLSDLPKFGGTITAVISKDEIQKGPQAQALYKAELTKNNQNVVRIYLYDMSMKPLQIENFGDTLGELKFKNPKTKKWVSHEFKFSKKEGFFKGLLPTSPRRPFSIDVFTQSNGRDLFMAFDHLN